MQIETLFSILGLILLQQESGCTIYVTLGSIIFMGPFRNAFGIKNEFEFFKTYDRKHECFACKSELSKFEYTHL